ncbi:uncharacterized protein MONBRDRAFT_24524 [Monosiga brevicollis MX1]|uniref:UFSP1/2/DUB catalytic domain-containing protein n=1 Tax=Monosiga brevicollis TaxID=81824 RepID=A9UWP3_MONBE|nr:uncharacterized protein MONBRDRAFT_24524 [Monosiga brevicollis MX1]EDQ90248.1 predicted protein [Monosiga brevicollis MX1]|eukprot:XP_001745015.1 hypothetical protein [Monosiga brevicollis MX1]
MAAMRTRLRLTARVAQPLPQGVKLLAFAGAEPNALIVCGYSREKLSAEIPAGVFYLEDAGYAVSWSPATADGAALADSLVKVESITLHDQPCSLDTGASADEPTTPELLLRVQLSATLPKAMALPALESALASDTSSNTKGGKGNKGNKGGKAGKGNKTATPTARHAAPVVPELSRDQCLDLRVLTSCAPDLPSETGILTGAPEAATLYQVHLDVLVYSYRSQPLRLLLAGLQARLLQQLRQALAQGGAFHHFLPRHCQHHVAALTVGGEKAETSSENDRLRNIHRHVHATPLPDGERFLVDGDYDYYHYMQDRFDDNGWGCAYRSCQTICSWFLLQGYSQQSVPTHAQIQQTLVNVGDKRKSFVGSRQWIGSQEIFFVLGEWFKAEFELESRFIAQVLGADLSTKARELAHHFRTVGTPVMIGGNMLAHTILGIDWDSALGDVRWLVLDPHYTGTDDIKTIVKLFKVWPDCAIDIKTKIRKLTKMPKMTKKMQNKLKNKPKKTRVTAGRCSTSQR